MRVPVAMVCGRTVNRAPTLVASPVAGVLSGVEGCCADAVEMISASVSITALRVANWRNIL
jgi:hypothetical protein